jgi:hypothetical protein
VVWYKGLPYQAAGWKTYASGFPVRVTRGANLLPTSSGVTRPTITTCEGWRGAIKGGKFDPAVDRFLDINAFPAQPVNFGNATRTNGGEQQQHRRRRQQPEQ